MEIRFRTGKENHILNDLISSKEKEVVIIGWSSDDDVIIKNWKFIDESLTNDQIINTINKMIKELNKTLKQLQANQYKSYNDFMNIRIVEEKITLLLSIELAHKLIPDSNPCI